MENKWEKKIRKPTTMKLLIVRSFAVALSLGIVCFFLNFLVLYQIDKPPFTAWPFSWTSLIAWSLAILVCVLLCFFVILLDSFDGQLTWRLKQMKPSMASILCWLYFIVAVASFLSFCWIIKFNRDLVEENNYTLMIMLYLMATTIYGFKYFVVSVRIVIKDMEND